MMKNRCVLMAGRSLSSDELLDKALQEIAVVVKSSANNQIESIIATGMLDLMFLEISKENPAEVDLLPYNNT